MRSKALRVAWLFALVSAVAGCVSLTNEPTPTPVGVPSGTGPTSQPGATDPSGPGATPLPPPAAREDPGNPWFGPAGQMPSGVIALTTLTCFDPEIALLTVGWPIGASATNDRDARQYVRDPRNAYRDRTLAAFQPDVPLPPDARSTGLRNGELELFVSPSDADTLIYVRRGSGVVERWPRATRFFACV